MSLSGLAKFVVGFLAGIVLLLLGSAAAGLFLFSTLSATPPRPVFPEEKQQKKVTNINTKTSTVAATNSKLVSSTQVSPSPSQETQLEPGAYKARVKWESGLSMRSEANFESSKVGGVAYNQEVVVLQDSDDKQWQKVRVVETNEEGWVKAGNLEQADTPQ
ncbi:SH3 type 3 domain-containing protein [Crinalium epipsammum PCC 9333]|uniref:SH3 type 3 domain-containing protein n=1 Tax=Crinalium epipsammum PCC 9333 TaxID=1173022 RepID=K9W059_9CYAN|nr:SH3 domain-containing protein [Crinalium epipsammum]AFZ13591.1 SH3 type 3 domain-containing protein [Crinalium epipsammum PCC 9333]